MRLSIPTAPAAMISPIWPRLRAGRRDARSVARQARRYRRHGREGAGDQAGFGAFSQSFVVNDRVDVALAADADGVHIGPDDMTVADARRLLGPGAIIGLSIKSVAEAEAAPVELIDYVGSGGVYVTLSKEQKKPPIGPQGLSRIVAVLKRRKANMPVCGIAGVDATNAGEVIAAGADGVAVISALSLAPDPAAAARTLRGIVDAALAKRGA